MKIICPHCDFVINLSGNQVHKALEALAKMPKEKTLKLKCTVCKKNIITVSEIQKFTDLISAFF